MKLWWKSSIVLLAILIAMPVFAQKWPMPGKVTEPVVKCVGCGGAIEGLPTAAYDDPLIDHVGRFVDSTTTRNIQNTGIRTVRARKIRVSPDGQRLYVQLGEAVGGYNLNKFFSTSVKAPMVSVSSLPTGQSFQQRPGMEKATMVDSLWYSESPDSGWSTYLVDSQRNLYDFDADDRGYVYVTSIYFGWGIAKDNGGGAHMGYVTQLQNSGLDNHYNVFVMKSGAKYYAVVSDGVQESAVYDVTTPASPSRLALRNGANYGILRWTKDDTSKRVAVTTKDGYLRIYDYQTFVNGGGPLYERAAPAGKSFTAISFDESGRVWAGESAGSGAGSGNLYRFTPSGGTFVEASFDIYGVGQSSTYKFTVETLHAGAGYVAALGFTPTGKDLALMKVDGGTPHRLDTKEFVNKYYYRAPAGHASPIITWMESEGVAIIESGSKTYLMIGAGSLGDVYEIEGGDSISAAVVSGSNFGTPNPNAQSTEPGPYYGDILRFKATTSSPGATWTIDWDFDNLDSGNANNASSALNETVIHQFTGLNTANKIQQARAVRAEVTTDRSISDEVQVALKLPKARILVPGRATAMTTENKVAFEAVAGEEFLDASDGVVEGHAANWVIDGVTVPKAPDEGISVGGLGPHTVALKASYGKYNPVTYAVTQPYDATVSSINYTVRPFLATIRPMTSSGTDFVFNADARFSSNPAFLNAATWVVTWSVQNGTNASPVGVEAVGDPAVGVIPQFTVPKANVQNGTIVKLQISVPTTAVPDAAFATYTTQLVLNVPDPTIQATGCTNALEPCTLTAASLSGAPTANWSLDWSIKKGTTTVKTGTTNPITFTPADAGTYTVTLTEKLFNKLATKTLTVAAQLCGPPPATHQAEISTDCGTNCQANTAITFDSNLNGYTVQPCDQLIWVWGDNTTNGSGASATHTYATNKTYNVKFTVKNTSGEQSWTKNVTIGGGGNPDPICTLPVGINFTYAGNLGCKPGTACKTGESVRFTALRGGLGLQSCDNTRWTIDGEEITTKSPSRTFTTTGAHQVSVVVWNTVGESAPSAQTLTIVPGNEPCSGSVPAEALGMEYEGPESGCASGLSTPCSVTENVQFRPTAFGYTFQTCDKFEWNFGDSTPVSALKQPTHRFNVQKNSYRVTLKVSNTSNPSGVTTFVDVPFAVVDVKPLPVLAFRGFPTTGSKGVAVSFTVDSNIPATGWTWNFAGTDNNTQTSVVGTSNTLSHTFANSGTFTVTVRARNAESPAGAQTAVALGTIVISDIPEFAYLLPVVARGPGNNGSSWRTDVQVYNPDPNVSATNQLEMTATLNGMTQTLRIADSTYIYEDFVKVFTQGTASGPVVIRTRAKFAPQIWTRTYTQTDSGTFGQFIPAIRLDAAGGGSAIGEGKYYIPGLRNDDAYRTNLGFVNPNGQPVNALVKVLDDQRLELGRFNVSLQSFQLDQFPITHPQKGLASLPTDRAFSLEIEVPAGQWLIAYASFIASSSNDPIYLQAVRASEIAAADFRESVIPGVGHVGDWRSDVTIYNPDAQSIVVDLAYHDQTGTKVGEAKSVVVRPGEFLQYADLLKQGVFGTVPDSLGMLRVSVPSTIPNVPQFPIMYARTYNDNGSGRTYGQGIMGFAAARANVKPNKPALVPGIRNNSKYYTNFGATNVSSTTAVVTVYMLDSITGVQTAIQQHTIAPNQSVVARVELGTREQASLKVEVTGGNVWAFCSMVDKGTFDPEYVPATPLMP